MPDVFQARTNPLSRSPVTSFPPKRSAVQFLLLGLGACCHGRQLVYTEVHAWVDDTTARPRPYSITQALSVR